MCHGLGFAGDMCAREWMPVPNSETKVIADVLNWASAVVQECSTSKSSTTSLLEMRGIH